MSTDATPTFQSKGKAKASCLVCGTEFNTYPYYIRKGLAKYCSKKCGYGSTRRAPLGKKNCWVCKTIKPATPEHFSTNPSKFDGLGSECVDCNNLKNKEARKTKRQQLIKLKGGKCASCGITNTDEAFFDIDHITPLFKQGKKRNQHNYSDIENLQVLCPNCHRLKTLKDRGYRD